jgi:hypothetical protein
MAPPSQWQSYMPWDSNERDGCFLEIENGRSDAEGSEGAGKIYFKKDEGEGGK